MRILGEKVEAVIFDKDGTLIDMDSMWLPWAEDIFQYMKKGLPDDLLHYEGFRFAIGIKKETGETDPKGPLAIGSMIESEVIVATKLYEWGIPWDAAVVHAKEGVHYANEVQNNSVSIRSVAGVENVLQKLKAEQIPIGVLTADDTDKAHQHLRKLGIHHFFDFVIGSDLVENGKPYPDMAYLASEKYGVPLSATMMIGDTNADMELGKRAGMKVRVGITPSENEVDHLHEADHIIYHYDELTITPDE
ncbi:HAD family hydrolase [Bacillus piscicola]|uniref:HAD family hydrolase n=1 Tax=Bacillus piscicola TaxID=1632684 RepID=UPI001F08EEE7|nr:HAD-IA family hydrolase [Bacillus piscicola]